MLCFSFQALDFHGLGCSIPLVSLIYVIGYRTIQLLDPLSQALLCCLLFLRHFADLLLHFLQIDFVLLRQLGIFSPLVIYLLISSD